MLAAHGVNWLLGAHPEASDVRALLVWVQVIGGVLGAALMARGIPSDVGTQTSDRSRTTVR